MADNGSAILYVAIGGVLYYYWKHITIGFNAVIGAPGPFGGSSSGLYKYLYRFELKKKKPTFVFLPQWILLGSKFCLFFRQMAL